MICAEAGMPTARFVRLVGVPERSYRRWQQRPRQGRPVKGPWPAPAPDRVEPVEISYADRFPAWGHRRLAALARVDGHHAPDSTVLRALRRSGGCCRSTTRPSGASTPPHGGPPSWWRPRAEQVSSLSIATMARLSFSRY